ncbi:MAG: DNA mismatch repair endonuclease MutL [Mariprofundales bacterium]|nr:DNA mismatch repair endonuclease MutL [Mariprofundales bacterium]
MSTTITILPPIVANQIAAGEVVERPASVVKELVENSIDAGSSQIGIIITEAGKRLISVEDNGDGMSSPDALLALQRHATSKIQQAEDLHHIASFGFRGEALPSIASVSRFRLHTGQGNHGDSCEVRVDGGANSEQRPAPPRQGTLIEIRDLFLNTPARLRFMRSDRTEEAAITEVTRALALANPSVAIRLELDGRKRLGFPPSDEAERIMAVMGKEFAANHHHQCIAHQQIEVSAFLGLPTYHHRDSSRMLFLLNGRAIRDKMLIAALRAGYRDVIFHDRYPVAVILIHLDPELVDINVHPAKREVRFAQPSMVRAAVVACVRTALESMGLRSATTTSEGALQAMTPAPSSDHPRHGGGQQGGSISPQMAPNMPFPARQQTIPSASRQLLFTPPTIDEDSVNEPDPRNNSNTNHDMDQRFGYPIGQIHRRYLLTQTQDGILLIDQHAAHERIGYEKLKHQLADQQIVSQRLLTPETWHAPTELAAWLLDHPDALRPFGVDLDAIDEEHFAIRAVPSLLGHEPPQALVAELAEAVQMVEGEEAGLGRVLERWLGNRACKAAIASGQHLNHAEQLALLEAMADTPNIAQCNHGRPTWIALSLNDLDRLFGRKG